MIFFFGTRASKIKERTLQQTTCPYCSSQNSFIVTTFSRYFHFFWIPIIPLFKTSVAECSHCKKSYGEKDFTPEMRKSLVKENENNPAKRPLWQGCGCLLLLVVGLVLFSLSLYGVYLRSSETPDQATKKDPRRELLETDLKLLTVLPNKQQDAIGFALKECIDYDLVSGIETDKIEYFASVNGNKVLVLLRIRDMKHIKPSNRKVIIAIVEDCLSQMENLKPINKFYIGVEGKWNTLLVKTPTAADLEGRFADIYKLVSFYDESRSTPDSQIDSLKISVERDSSLPEVP